MTMAGADYYSCDMCGSKTFYDADVPYRGGREGKKTNPAKKVGDIPVELWPLGVGYMKVLCKDCAETYKVIIQRKGNAQEGKNND